jgi:hypothetical protein
LSELIQAPRSVCSTWTSTSSPAVGDFTRGRSFARGQAPKATLSTR